ncbi:MAG: FAD:protein FMN transferase, partial [Kiritimatiellales bacterium]|nr:FAD:protein FMN transferase [Kiritimatiellales bacterium]
FSHSKSTEPIKVSEDFATVVERSLHFSQITDGAFDPTLEPLLDLWGFGSGGKGLQVPTDAEIAQAKAKTGWRKIKVIQPDHLQKSDPDVSLALGAIAKGYGVDAVGRILDANGCRNWFVEIGGEVVVKGLNPDGVPWKVGIQYPTTNPLDERVHGVLHMTHGAVATSGNYRNFNDVDGTLYTHILDPCTGRTVLAKASSVSVYASNCMDADGIATALFVMGPEKGIEWVEQQPGIETMFLVCEDNGEIVEKSSSGFVEATGCKLNDR